ncbi:MAG: FtsX-like permease family protein [Bacteroidota bacterium]|nr:FtsX-like permease family protein [Bacteroidota bacterium]
MNFSYFVAHRIIFRNTNQKGVSQPIITIAVLAIVIGVLMMIIAVATGIGLREKIREKIAAFNGHIIVSNFDNNQSDVSITPIDKHLPVFEDITRTKGVRHLQAVITKAGIIRTESDFEGFILKGVGQEYDFSFLKEYLVQGNIPILNEQKENAQVLISEYLADRMQLELGDKFTTHFLKENPQEKPNLRQFEIVGIYNSGFQDFDKNFIIGDIRHIQKMNRWSENQVGNIEVFIDDFEQISNKGNQIYEMIPHFLDAQTIEDKYFTIFEWLKITDSNIYLIITLMLVVGIVNITVALLVLILERTSMIGILKALGATNWQIRKIFLYNALYLIAKGLLIGNAIGLVFLFLQKYFAPIKLDPKSYYVDKVPVYIHIDYFVYINVMVVVISLIVLLIPSYVITRISPVKAIRFE